MLGMLDYQARAAYAHDRAETLRDAMRAGQRRKTEDDAGRRRPARAASPLLPARLRTNRGTV